jgi:predicted permease
MEQSLEREVAYHLDRRVDDLIRSGLARDEALREARIEFGGFAQVQEEVRETWVWRWLQNFARDARYSLRGLCGNPGFTITAVLSLALAIGANTAIFSILHALILRSLPVSDPGRLVIVTRNENISSPYPLYEDIRDHSQTLEGVLSFRTAAMRFRKDADTERVTGVLVSGSYFNVLGVLPAIGTSITDLDDHIPGSGGPRGPVAVLSHGFWLRRFGGRPGAIGARILLNDHPFTIIGVAPQGFQGTEVGVPVDVFAPIAMQEALLPGLGKALSQPRSDWLRIIARLKSGTPVSQAEADLTTLLHRYNEANFGLAQMTNAARRRALMEQRIVLQPGHNGTSPLRKQYAAPLWVLISVVMLVLLIACANVASLLLSRGETRRREMAIRLSVGASRGRIVNQLFTESLLLSIAGAGTGLLLARWMRDALLLYLPPGRILDAPMDSRILLFTVAVSAGAALLFGLAPALQSAGVDVAPAIKGDAASKPSRVLFRKGLVVFQIGLSFLLLITATLFLRSLHKLLAVDPGFVRQNILVASVESGPGLELRLLNEARNLPGVTSAALADSPPLGIHTGWSIYVPGYVPKGNESSQSPSVGFVSPGYFATMGIPLLLGRDIDERDVAGAREVMVVNETFARHFFGNDSPIGRRVGTTEGVYRWEIIGVVKDSKYSGLREGALDMLYVPSRPGPWASRTVVHLRTAGNPAALAAALRRKVHDLDASATIYDLHTVEEEMDRSLLRERLVGTITGIFGGLALLLSAIGLYGLISYGVERRTREFGIRIAVGARASSIVGLVLREAAWLLLAGVGVGLIAARFLAHYLNDMLFGMTPSDPTSAGVAIAVLLAAAIAAEFVPAWRASRVDPVQALRRE